MAPRMAAVVAGISFIIPGVLLTVYAREIQRYLLDLRERQSHALKWTTPIRLVDGASYVVKLRVSGGLCILVAIFCFWIVWAGE